MRPEPKRRPRRVPFTPEEVAAIVAIKKRKEQLKLQKFKKSKAFKIQNVCNIACFFVYWEIVLCFFGPAWYSMHYARQVSPTYGNRYDKVGKPIVSELEFTDVNGEKYNFIVDDFINMPQKYSRFYIAHDFILQKNLKGQYEGNEQEYRLFQASPVLLFILLSLVSSIVSYTNNLNENSYSLMALSVLNGLTLIGILVL